MMDTILIVDDEPQVLSSLLRCLRNERSYDIITVLSGEEALRVMRDRYINVVISDQSMPRIQGVDFLVLVKKYSPKTVRILLTGNPSLELALKAVNQGEVYRFLAKPWDDDELREVVSSALGKRHAKQLIAECGPCSQPISGEICRLEHEQPVITGICMDDDGSPILPDVSREALDAINCYVSLSESTSKTNEKSYYGCKIEPYIYKRL